MNPDRSSITFWGHARTITTAARYGAVVSAIVVLAVAALGLASTVTSIANLVYPVGDVEIGFGDLVMSDAASILVGNPLYADFRTGYTSTVYPPLYPLMIAALLRVALWNGWPLLVDHAMMLVWAGAAWTYLSARLQPSSRIGHRLAWLLAAGTSVVHLARLPAPLSGSVILGGRADSPMWAAGFVALVMADLWLRASARRGRRLLVGSGLLVGIAFMFKQTGAVFAPVVVAGLLIGTAGRDGLLERASARDVVSWIGALTGLVALVSAIMIANSGRHYVEKVFVLPFRFATDFTIPEAVLLSAAAFAGVLLILALIHAVAFVVLGPRGLYAHVTGNTLLYLLLAGSFLFASVVRTYHGADWNQHVGFGLVSLLVLGSLSITFSEREAWWPTMLALAMLVVAPSLNMDQWRVTWVPLADRLAPAQYRKHELLATSVELASSPRTYDPRRTYVETLRSGHAYPTLFTLADHYAIGLGPSHLLSAVEEQRFGSHPGAGASRP